VRKGAPRKVASGSLILVVEKVRSSRSEDMNPRWPAKAGVKKEVFVFQEGGMGKPDDYGAVPTGGGGSAGESRPSKAGPLEWM
jgi:hypothetical protein